MKQAKYDIQSELKFNRNLPEINEIK